MSVNNLPPAVQENIQKLQNLQNQVQSLRIQLEANQREISEINATLKEVKILDDNEELYKSIGSIFFKNNAMNIRKDLTDQLELLELKVKTLKKQEDRSSKQLNELNESISLQLGSK